MAFAGRGIPEIVKDGVTGWLVEQASAASFAAAIDRARPIRGAGLNGRDERPRTGASSARSHLDAMMRGRIRGQYQALRRAPDRARAPAASAAVPHLARTWRSRCFLLQVVLPRRGGGLPPLLAASFGRSEADRLYSRPRGLRSCSARSIVTGAFQDSGAIPVLIEGRGQAIRGSFIAVAGGAPRVHARRLPRGRVHDGLATAAGIAPSLRVA